MFGYSEHEKFQLLLLHKHAEVCHHHLLAGDQKLKIEKRDKYLDNICIKLAIGISQSSSAGHSSAVYPRSNMKILALLWFPLLFWSLEQQSWNQRNSPAWILGEMCITRKYDKSRNWQEKGQVLKISVCICQQIIKGAWLFANAALFENLFCH